jgi:hypothetical protein
MTQTGRSLPLSVLGILALSASNLAAQGNATAKPNVVLGGTSGSPGQSVVVPIYLSPPEGVEVGRLKLEITFVSVNLKHEKTEPGIAADMANAKVNGEVTLGKNDQGVETSTVTVTVEAPSGTPPKGVPAGLLAYLTLQISEKGRPATIALRTKLEATELGSGKKLDQLRSADAEIEVLAPGTEPAVACFFFTH